MAIAGLIAILPSAWRDWTERVNVTFDFPRVTPDYGSLGQGDAWSPGDPGDILVILVGMVRSGSIIINYHQFDHDRALGIMVNLRETIPKSPEFRLVN